MDTKIVYSNELSNKLTSAFLGKIETRPVPSSYILGLFVVTVLMLLIPVVYFGLIAGVVYSLIWYGQHSDSLLGAATSVRGRGSGFFMLMLVAPFIVGIVLLIFLIKALFKPNPPKPQVRKLFRNNEPLLFAFVDKICEVVGSPKPAEIHVDCHVNASASFLNGWRGIMTNNLVLTIGLPLVNGMTLREFSGVVAHEMGHFSQPTAMRLTYIIWTINEYLEHIATDDSVENSVDTAHQVSQAGSAGCLIYMLSIIFIFFTRMVLFGLMKLGHVVSFYMMRQMEYDADRRAAALIGADAFESGMKKLPVLSAAEEMSFKDISYAFNDGRLADDLPVLISTNLAKLTPQAQSKIQKELTEETGTFDTHPSERDRIMAVRNERFTPKFLVEHPANILFKNMSTLSRTATVDMYVKYLGYKFKPEMLKSAVKVSEDVRMEEVGEEVVGRLLQAIIPPYRPLPFTETILKPAESREKQYALLNMLRLNAFTKGPIYRKNLKLFLQADIDWYNATLACNMLSSGFVVPPKVLTKDLGLPEGTLTCAERVRDENHAKKDELISLLSAYETDAAAHLVESLRLWFTPEVTRKWDANSAKAKEIEDLLPVLQHLSELMFEVHSLEYWHTAMIFTYNSLPEGVAPKTKEQIAAAVAMANSAANTPGTRVYGGINASAPLLLAAEATCESTYKQLVIISEKLGDLMYPFDHERGPISIRELIIPALPPNDAVFKVDQIANATVNALYETYDRLLRRLCVLGEEGEKAIGLAVLNGVNREDCLPTRKKEPEFQVI